MQRPLLASLMVCLATGLVSSASSFGVSAEEQGPGTISQGSLVDSPQVEVSEGPRPGYSQVVDNSTEDRFDAPGWEERPGTSQYGENYAYSDSSEGEGLARYKVKIPGTGSYSVYARWPARTENSAATRFGISTASGTQWSEVDQQKDGGMWVRLGAYKMKAGDHYSVEVSSESDDGEGEVVADAVMILSGEQANPEEAAGAEATGGDATFEAAAGLRKSREVVRKARRHIGTRYVRSPPHRCRAYRKEDCSCHTKVVFRKFGRSLPDNPPSQWKRGKRIKKKSNLRRGDLVFFDENRNRKLQPWDHVGIYSGNGYLVHASGYFGQVVESKMKYIKGYWGAKRLKKLH